MNLTSKGGEGPARLVSDIHVVEVGIEHDRRCISLTPDEPDHITCFIFTNLIEPELLHFAVDHTGNLLLPAGKASGLNQALEELDTGFQIECFHGGQLPTLPGASSRLPERSWLQRSQESGVSQEWGKGPQGRDRRA